MIKLFVVATLGVCLLCACNKQAGSSSNAAGSNSVTTTAKSDDDKKAEGLLLEAYALIKQEKANEAEAKLTEVIALKPKLSPNVRAQVAPAIIGLGMVDPKLGVKLGKQWGE
jgi:hypothetical protein